MKAITFKQFVNSFCFRELVDCDLYDTSIIRIYLDDSEKEWFEYGVYDFGANTWDIVQKSLNKKICKSYINSIAYDTELNILKIVLQDEETIE